MQEGNGQVSQSILSSLESDNDLKCFNRSQRLCISPSLWRSISPNIASMSRSRRETLLFTPEHHRQRALKDKDDKIYS